MRLLENPRRILWGGALVAIVSAIVAGSVYYFRPSTAAPAMLASLPPGDGPLLYVDVSLLRRTGVLEQLAGKPGGEEPEYLKFVEASGFDYRRDLDAALVQWRNGTALCVLKGRFDEERLAAYARSSGGLCAKGFCSLPGSVPERRISFQPLGRNMMAVAAGADAMGAATIRESASQPAFHPPAGPLWISLPSSSFHADPEFPPGFSTFLEALDGAQRAIIIVEAAAGGFEVQLNAPCTSAEQAKQIAERLTRSTAQLRALIARSGKTPEASSPAAVLSSGTFHVEQSVVRGRWPLNGAFFEGLGK